ncbi:MAG: glycine zipper 2TM domain-containing protein [Pseudomonadota bacterium]
MNKFLIALPILALTLAGCQTAEQNAVAGGLGGAAIGAAVSNDDDRLTGALVGAAVGVAGSTFVRPTGTAGRCYYRNSAGQQYIAAC